MAEEKKDTGAPAIKIAHSFAESLRGADLFALIARGGSFIKIPLRHMTANDRAAIDARHPDPFPPRKFNAQGAPYLDIYDEKYRRECDEKALLRQKARLAFLLSDEFMGTADQGEKIKRVWSQWSEADILAIDRQGANPYETREEGVQAQEEAHAPFGQTDAAS